MPAVKRFSVSFAKYPTNGTSASFKYFSSSPPCLACLQTCFLTLGYFFIFLFFSTWPSSIPGFRNLFFELFYYYYNFFYPWCFWTVSFLTLPDILFLTRVPTSHSISEVLKLGDGNVSRWLQRRHGSVAETLWWFSPEVLFLRPLHTVILHVNMFYQPVLFIRSTFTQNGIIKLLHNNNNTQSEPWWKTYLSQ